MHWIATKRDEGVLRPELADALNIAWAGLGEPGEWLTAEQRLQVAMEARQAWQCAGCAAQLAALSPYALPSTHNTVAALPAPWVHVVHSVVRDSARIGRRFYNDALTAGMAAEIYVEVVAVTVLTTTVDSFLLAAGAPLLSLPFAAVGEPSRKHNADATPGPGWVPTTAPERAGADFADFYADGMHFNIRRALTLLKAETRRIWNLLNPLYLADPRIHELDGESRGITRAQMEFLAARASALLGCYY